MTTQQQGWDPVRAASKPGHVGEHLPAAALPAAAGRGEYRPLALDVLRLEGGRVAEITTFVYPELFPAFDLPPSSDRPVFRGSSVLGVSAATKEIPVRTLAVNTFVSLDRGDAGSWWSGRGSTGGFTLGGWAVNYLDAEMIEQVARSDPYELLLGRGTYEIFAAHWPYDGGPIANQLNSTRKHVASRTLKRWSGATPSLSAAVAVRGGAEESGWPRDPGPRQPDPDPDAARARSDRRVPALDIPRGGRCRQTVLR